MADYPDDMDNRIHLAYVHYYLGQFDRSREVAESLIALGDDTFPVILLLARLDYQHRDYEAAINLIETEITENPINISVRLYREQMLLHAYYQTNQYEKFGPPVINIPYIRLFLPLGIVKSLRRFSNE